MRKNKLRQIWDDGQCAVSSWLAIPSSYSAEGVARQGFDAVTVDLQHGMIDVATAIPMLQAISTTDAVPMLRVPGNEPTIIMKALDAGAYGIICPMISTVDEATRFVAACRYPPQGDRSFGPARGLLYGGADYFAHANAEIVTLAMIETAAGLDNIDAILAVEGLDGIFIGPNDLSLALGEPPSSDPAPGTRAAAAIDHLLARSRAAGRHAGIFCANGTIGSRRRLAGFDFVVPGNEFNLLVGAARRELDLVRGGTPPVAAASQGY
ncbi:MAG TPA: aldolase/citrate lyase family protein [Devosia sp.]|nr:aldolase/citrate lyase family protein [Devosia sp.]